MPSSTPPINIWRAVVGLMEPSIAVAVRKSWPIPSVSIRTNALRETPSFRQRVIWGARYVIHAVGPRWAGGQRGEAELLQSAYRRSLELATQHQCRSVALPALSTGAYGYPLQPASQIALSTAIQLLHQQPGKLERVHFVLFSDEPFQVFAATLRNLLPVGD
jgi:O-acetyl-ADP-ribose deacetylase (regulator of RNase III)